ncbi:MAG: tetratricopeptide repeat protein [Dissulfurimicrobium sp.]|uniref:tetratricopeptide repeat protein n=1 Tax=Dissulfurimicrobium sp. TaxID=2022436 RepID=UPI00404A5D01
MLGRKTIRFFLFFLLMISMILTLYSHGSASVLYAGTETQTKEGQSGGDVSSWLNDLQRRTPQAQSGKLKAGMTMSDPARPEIISVDFYKTDIHNVFRLIGEVSGKNIVVDNDIKGDLTLFLQNVPWTFVLQVVKSLKGLESMERDNTIMIYPASKKVAWAGEGGVGLGSLDIIPKSQPVNTPVVESKERYQTPMDQIAKAEGLIKEAASAEKQGKPDDALELYKKASDMWPENTSLAKKVASIALGRHGDEISGLNYAKRVLKFAPKDSEAAAFAAIALSRMGKNTEARVYFERAISTDKPPLTTLYNYAVFCFSQGLYRDALRLINRIENNYSISPELMMLKAEVYEGLGNTREAISEYNAIINAGREVPDDISQQARARLERLSAQTDGSH